MFAIDADRKVRSDPPRETVFVLTVFIIIIKVIGSKNALRMMTASLITVRESSERREFLEVCLKLLITRMPAENLAKESW